MATRLFIVGRDYLDLMARCVDQALLALSRNQPYLLTWSAAVKSVQPRDLAFFFKSGKDLPGLFAAGRVVEAEPVHRLNKYPDCTDYSNAYTCEFHKKNPTVLIQLSSVARLDCPFPEERLVASGFDRSKYRSGSEMKDTDAERLKFAWHSYCHLIGGGGVEQLQKQPAPQKVLKGFDSLKPGPMNR
ncbi:MAG: hypothetical protein AAF609_24075 [Cyanobacteria bacterium P01_C01_bin.120]